MNGLERKSRVIELACRRAPTVRRLQGSPQAFVMPDGLAYHALRSGPLSQVRRVLFPEVMLRTLLRQRDQGYRPITPRVCNRQQFSQNRTHTRQLYPVC